MTSGRYIIEVDGEGVGLVTGSDDRFVFHAATRSTTHLDGRSFSSFLDAETAARRAHVNGGEEG